MGQLTHETKLFQQSILNLWNLFTILDKYTINKLKASTVLNNLVVTYLVFEQILNHWSRPAVPLVLRRTRNPTLVKLFLAMMKEDHTSEGQKGREYK